MPTLMPRSRTRGRFVSCARIVAVTVRLTMVRSHTILGISCVTRALPRLNPIRATKSPQLMISAVSVAGNPGRCHAVWALLPMAMAAVEVSNKRIETASRWRGTRQRR